uniref:GIY-YIG domain-containing protein n=1 Tax=Morchella importuna TaxID=1174673 RepID=A0A650AFC5_9PEZI|nr:hypothetical protein [Morchella importuna]QGN66743.1 hypothetical protein [Morchella importuna]
MKNITNVLTKLLQRGFSTNSSSKFPEKVYKNAANEKAKILKENAGQTGIYCFQNLKDGLQYIGSAKNLSERLKYYYSETYMKGQLLRGKSIIYGSILKYGLDNFSLSILEYCELECLIKREKYYIELLNPVYNIIKDPTVPPMLGRKHTDVTIEKMQERLHSKETRTKISTGPPPSLQPYYASSRLEGGVYEGKF